MIRDTSEHNETVKPNDFEIDRLRAALPEYFDRNGNFMIDRLQDALQDDDVDLTREGYELKFLGKSYAKYLTSTKTETVVVPDLDHNAKPENQESENLYIVGDNLDALKHLLGSYSGQVKCIYIDPPYNTGTDGFVYNDDFKFTAEQLVEKIGISEDEAERTLNIRGKSSHSAWLTFMYPRMQLARDLLADDGVIFVSIDDNEHANLKIIFDEIFGEQNFEGSIHWRRRHNQPNDPTKLIGLVAEHILVYAKDSEVLKSTGVGKLPLTGKFSNPDNDPRGEWNSKPWKVGSGQGGSNYRITTPSGEVLDETWMGEEATFKALLEDNRIYFPKNGSGMPRKKIFKTERQGEGQSATNWFPHELFGHNQTGSAELAELFDNTPGIFTNPKPVSLLRNLCLLGNIKDGEIFLDFFSGSAGAAQAILDLNAEDKVNRKYIMVQLDESVPLGKAADKAGYATVDEIGRERIKRAAAKIQDETSAEIDYGFKLYRLEEPSGEILDDLLTFDPEQDGTLLAGDYVSKFALNGTPGRDTVLATWLVEDGHGLTAQAQKVALADYQLDVCGDSAYIIEPGLAGEDVVELVRMLEKGELEVSRVVVFGYSMTFSVMHELKRNLSVLKSGRTVSVIERL